MGVNSCPHVKTAPVLLCMSFYFYSLALESLSRFGQIPIFPGDKMPLGSKASYSRLAQKFSA